MNKGIDALRMLAEMQAKLAVRIPPGHRHNPHTLLHAVGQGFEMTDQTFAGRRKQAKMCYMNAGKVALDGDGSLIYCEGHVLCYGVPIAYAWLVDAQGKVVDQTLTPDGIDGFFGIPFKTSYLRATVLRTGIWGILDAGHNRQVYIDHPAAFVAMVPGSR